MSGSFDSEGRPRRWPAVLIVGASILLPALFAFAGPGQAGQAEPATPERPLLNVQFLIGAPRAQVTLIMQATSRSLGVVCEHCHVREGWHIDDKPEKRTARNMMHMISVMGPRYFDVMEVPSCWTCHRGETTPQLFEPGTGPAPAVPGVGRGGGRGLPEVQAPFIGGTMPAGEAYENVTQYTDIPARDLAAVMQSYSRALGVGCEHCHVEGDFASDDKVTKVLARRMLEIRLGLQGDFFDARNVLTCWTCHRGETTPQMQLPPELMPGRD